MEIMKSFADKINELNTEQVYPFHMPGHKRRMKLYDPYSIDITEIDGYDNLHSPEGMIKELEERLCSLYDEEHKFIEKSYVLVNGSTCGILAAISAVTGYGDKILMARNSHKSAYNAVCIRGLDADYIYPEYIAQLGMNSMILPEKLREKLLHNSKNNNGKCYNLHVIKDSNLLINRDDGKEKMQMMCEILVDRRTRDDSTYKAVYITSPTYEGIVSDIREISKIAHEVGIPLIVDEAHGAHFGLAKGFPDTAIKNGADIVIQSIHKTLMGMTQTAALHVSREAVASGRVDIEKLEYYLRVYQSSSPSYVLMSSVDECVSALENKRDREELFKEYVKNIKDIHKKSKKWKDIHIFEIGDVKNVYKRKIFDYDCGKLVIYSESGCMSGRELYDILRDKYNLQLEMSLGRYCLAMTSCMDSDEGFERLAAALGEIDADICEKKSGERYKKDYVPLDDEECADNSSDDWEMYGDIGKSDGCRENSGIRLKDKCQRNCVILNETGCADNSSDDCRMYGHIRLSDEYEGNIEHKEFGGDDTWTQGHRRLEKVCTISQAFEMKKEVKRMSEGDIAGDYGYVYPPGIPFIVPGEVVTNEIICDIINAKASGYEVHGVEFDDGVPYMKCVGELRISD